MTTSNIEVQFVSLLPAVQIPDEKINIPIDSTIYDLNEIVASLTDQHVYFDFFIQDMLITQNLNQFIAQNAINTEDVVVIMCSFSPKIPSLKSQANTPDWISALAQYNGDILAANYDGSLQIVEKCYDQQLRVKGYLLLSRQSLKHVLEYRGWVCAAGDDGVVKFLNNADAEQIAEFKLGQVPVANLLKIQDSVAVYAEDYKLHVISEYDIAFGAKTTKKGILRGNPCETAGVLDLAEFAPSGVFAAAQSLTYLQLQQPTLLQYDLAYQREIMRIAGPAQVTSLFQCGSQLLCGYMDRAVRLYDVRAGARVQRTFIGSKSHIVAVRQKSDVQFFSADIGGEIYLYDIRATRPYHKIDVYDYEMDKKSDYGRVLDIMCSESELYVGGSARKLFLYDV